MTRGGEEDRTSDFLKYLLIATASLYLLTYLVLAWYRLRYPYELEYLEGGMVDEVRWLLAGKSLYGPPMLEFIPEIYTPLYLYVSAGLAAVLGAGFFPLRLVSFLSSLASFALIYLLVKSETRNRLAGFLAAGLFAATFRLGGAWFDIARVDSLFLALFLGGIYLVRFHPEPLPYAFAGLLLSLSFLTKQTALVMSAPLLLYAFYFHRRASLFLAGTMAVFIGGSTLLGNLASHGWYSYYVFELPRDHGLEKHMVFLFWTRDILKPLPIVLLLMWLMHLVNRRYQLLEKREVGFYLAVLAGMVGGAWLSRAHVGGYANSLIPAHAALAIWFGLAVGMLLKQLKQLPAPQQGPWRRTIYLACLLQLGVLLYNPLHQLPTAKDKEAGDRVVAMIKAIPGEVYIPDHTYLATLAGKKTYAEGMAVAAVLKGKNPKKRAAFEQEMELWLKEHRFAAVVEDQQTYSFHRYFYPKMRQYYVEKERIFDDNTVFYPVTGGRLRPEMIYVPKP